MSKLDEARYETNVHNALITLPFGGIGWAASSLGSNRARNEAAAVGVCHSVKQADATSFDAQNSNGLPPFQLILGGECLMVPATKSALCPSLALQAR